MNLPDKNKALIQAPVWISSMISFLNRFDNYYVQNTIKTLIECGILSVEEAVGVLNLDPDNISASYREEIQDAGIPFGDIDGHYQYIYNRFIPLMNKLLNISYLLEKGIVYDGKLITIAIEIYRSHYKKIENILMFAELEVNNPWKTGRVEWPLQEPSLELFTLTQDLSRYTYRFAMLLYRFEELEKLLLSKNIELEKDSRFILFYERSKFSAKYF